MSVTVGAWLFRHRTALGLPIAAAILLTPSVGTPRHLAATVFGLVLTLGGEGLRLWGVHQIGVISRTRSDRLGPLIETGPFALVRNPLYLGNLAIWVGFALTAGLLWLAPIVLGLLAVEYHAIVRWEEQLLESRLGEAYREYCARVPRWIPRPSTRSGRARSEPLAVSSSNRERSATSVAGRLWLETLVSERGTLIAIAAGYLLLGTKARF